MFTLGPIVLFVPTSFFPYTAPCPSSRFHLFVDHSYFFLEDVFAKEEALGGLGGPRLLKTPAFM